MSDSFNAYYTWLGIPPSEQPPHHYRLLGIQLFEANPEVIEKAADRQTLHLKSFQTGPRAALSQGLLNEVVAAAACLLDPVKKAAYDRQLAAATPAEENAWVLPVGDDAKIDAVPRVTAKGRRGPRKSAGAGSLVQTVQVVAGGGLGLALAVLVLSYIAGIDPLGWSKAARESQSKATASKNTKQDASSDRYFKGETTDGSRPKPETGPLASPADRVPSPHDRPLAKTAGETVREAPLAENLPSTSSSIDASHKDSVADLGQEQAVRITVTTEAAPAWPTTAGGFPRIDGQWEEGGKYQVMIHQQEGSFTAYCTYNHPKAGEIRWRCDGKISNDGQITSTLVHTKAPRRWKSQVRTAKVQPDGLVIEGHGSWKGGGHDFTWKLVSRK